MQHGSEKAEHLISGEPKDTKVGCLWTAIFVVSVLWIFLASVLSLTVMWLAENFLFDGSLGIPDVRFIVGGVYAVCALVPLVMFSTLRNPYQPFYRTWLLASLMSVLGVPVRLLPLTDWQTNAVFIIASLLILIFINRRKISTRQPAESGGNQYGLIWMVVLIGGLLLIPYALWGAFGSPVDVLLALTIAALLGMYTSTLISFFKLRWQQNEFFRRDANKVDLSLCIGISLIILNASLPLVGMQFNLLVSFGSLIILLVVISHHAWSWTSTVGHTANGLLVGISIALPLLFLDGDELMLVTASAAGELITYALRMAGLHGLISLLSGFILWIMMKKIQSMKNLVWFSLVAGAVWITGLMLYFLAGQPGFFGERLFVILKEQVDFSQQVLPDDPLEKRDMVFQTLKRTAETSQADLRKELERFNIGFQPYYLVNAIEVDGGPFVRLWLSRRAEVDRILSSPRLRPLAKLAPIAGSDIRELPAELAWNLEKIGAQRVWEELGVRGDGILIGHSDSGVQGNHPEIAAQYRGWDGKQDYNWYDAWHGSQTPVDIGGHGTHTLATIVGSRTGVAPGANWIGCVNLARNLGNPALYLDCWQFMLAPFPQDGDSFLDGQPALGAQVLNNSWGCPEVEGCDATVFLPAVSALKAAGIFVVVSAGNSGFAGCESVDSPPAIYEQVLSVGAINRFGDLAGFSSVGPVVADGSNRIKPEILAPGEEILSAYPGSSYTTMSGTSMAGPHLAGVVALMWSANPDLIGDIELTRQIIFDTAKPYQGVLPACVELLTRPANGVGYGVVDAFAAVKRAVESR
ncbi:MAG: S8 family serine peptidase [Bellilinea sp.]|jgi:hypothetical protein